MGLMQMPGDILAGWMHQDRRDFRRWYHEDANDGSRRRPMSLAPCRDSAEQKDGTLPVAMFDANIDCHRGHAKVSTSCKVAFREYSKHISRFNSSVYLWATTSPIEMVMLLAQLVSQCCRHLV